MKTPLLYGTLLTFVGALLTLGLYFAGFHDSPEKLQTSRWIALGIGLPISIALYAFALRDRRRDYPADRQWGYGPAVGTGVLTALWSSLFSGIFTYLYMAFINPRMGDLVYQAQVAEMEKKGIPEAQIENAASIMHRMLSPAVMTVTQTFGGFIFAVIFVLIIAIFFRNPIAASVAGEPQSPPPLA